ncbi:MAG: MFS transporter [Gammaproteobacteria bacterium]
MNLTILLLAAVSFIVVAVMTVTGPLLPLVAVEFGITVGDAGIIVAAFAVPYGACQILFGPLGDRYGKTRVIAVALGAASLFVIGSGLAVSIESLAAMRFCSGLSMAATIPLAMAYIADEVPFARRQPVMGRFINGLVLGQIAGGVLGGIAAEYFDWRQVFYVLGGCAALFAAGLALIGRRGGHREAAPARPPGTVLRLYLSLFRERRSRDLIITGTLEGMLVFGLLAYLGAFLRHEHALEYALIGLALGTYGVGGLVYAAAVYRLVPLLGERRMIVVGTALLGASYLVLRIVPAWWMTLPVFLVAGFGFYLFHNTLQTRATELSPEARGTAVSLWVFMLFIGQGLGVWLFGRVIDVAGYGSAFLISGLGVITLGLWFQACVGRDAVDHAREA